MKNCIVRFRTIWQWAVVMLIPFAGTWFGTLVNPESVYIKLIYGAGTMFMMWAGPAYFVKLFRYESDIWKGKGMIRRDMDSGAKQAARIYLGKSRPHILLEPLSHFALKWTYRVGEIDLSTGSVSVYNMFVCILVKEEAMCRAIGSNDAVSPAGVKHIRNLIESTLITDEQFSVIDGLCFSGLKIKG